MLSAKVDSNKLKAPYITYFGPDFLKLTTVGKNIVVSWQGGNSGDLNAYGLKLKMVVMFKIGTRFIRGSNIFFSGPTVPKTSNSIPPFIVNSIFGEMADLKDSIETTYCFISGEYYIDEKLKNRKTINENSYMNRGDDNIYYYDNKIPIADFLKQASYTVPEKTND